MRGKQPNVKWLALIRIMRLWKGKILCGEQPSCIGTVCLLAHCAGSDYGRPCFDTICNFFEALRILSPCPQSLCKDFHVHTLTTEDHSVDHS